MNVNNSAPPQAAATASATETFARWYAESFRRHRLTADVVHHAKRAVIDWYASLYPGLDAPAVQALEAVLADDLDRGGCAPGRAAALRRRAPRR